MPCAQGKYTCTPLAHTDSVPLPVPSESFGLHPATTSCGADAPCEPLTTLRYVTHEPEMWMVEATDCQPDDGVDGPLGLAVCSG